VVTIFSLVVLKPFHDKLKFVMIHPATMLVRTITVTNVFLLQCVETAFGANTTEKVQFERVSAFLNLRVISESSPIQLYDDGYQYTATSKNKTKTLRLKLPT
jgi:hypothetical protein